MDWLRIIHLIVYLLAVIIAAIALYGLNWAQVMRKTHAAFGVVVYIMSALALGYLVGSLINFFIQF